MNKDTIWLIGAGKMAMEYSKVLKALDKEFTVIGRSEEGVTEFFRATGIHASSGGLDAVSKADEQIPDFAINAVSVNQLYDTSLQLMDLGVRNILVEKPAALEISQLENLSEIAASKNINLLIAYNRRFYQSVRKAMEMIKEEGGIRSFHFEFTEWENRIRNTGHPAEVKEKWVIANSSHVIDLAFFLGGYPSEISTFHDSSLNWHRSSASFTGAGRTERGALFSYQANWNAPGRWSLEFMTDRRRYIFRPVEKLQVQEKEKLSADFTDLDYTIDEEYKAGLFLMCEEFLQQDFSHFCSIAQHRELSGIYFQMANY